MSRVLVGPARSIRSATDGGRSGSFSCVLMGEESTVLLRSALRSTAFGRRLPSGEPSIPLPRCAGEVGVLSALGCRLEALPYGFREWLFRRLPPGEDYRLAPSRRLDGAEHHNGSIESDTLRRGPPGGLLRVGGNERPPRPAEGLWCKGGNDLHAQAPAERDMGGRRE
jgi:hypothetical protein